MACLKKRDGWTHERTHACMENPKAICPLNFFEVRGITYEVGKTIFVRNKFMVRQYA